jgi:hypothetical protein
MPHIRTISPEEADGALKTMYDAAIQRAGRVFNVISIQGLNPKAMRASLGLYQALMIAPGPLTRTIREMLATVTSRTMNCFY